jgi:hypothetical protein
MSNFVIPQNAMIISVEKTAVNEATNQAIKVGQVLDAGTVLVLSPDSQFTVIYLDGSQAVIEPVLNSQVEVTPVQNEELELLFLSDNDLELLDKAIEIETAAGDSVLANHVTQFLASLRNDTAVIKAPGLIQAEAVNNAEDFSENLNRNPVSSILKTTYSPQLTITDPSLSVVDGKITISGTVTDYHPASSIQIEFSALFFTSEVFKDVSIIDGKYSLVLSTSELKNLPQGFIQLSVKVIENGQTTAVIHQGTTLDTIAPEKPIVSLSQDTNADGILNKQEIGNADTISYRITIADNDLEIGDYLEVDGIRFDISPEMLSEREFSVNIPRGNVQGSVSPEIYLFDAKGNKSDLADISTFTVDTIAPGQNGDIYSAPIIEVQEANSGLNLEEASDGTAIVVRLPSGTNAGDTVSLALTLPNGVVKPLSIVVDDSQLSTGFVNFEIESALLLANQGDFSVTAIVTDIAGNDSSISDTFQFTSDYEIGNAPSLNVNQVIVQGLNAESFDSVTTLFVTMGDGVEIGDFIQVFINTDAQDNSILVPILESVVAGEQLQIDIAPLYFANDGDYEISVELTDPAGNTSARSNGLNVTVDTVAPSAPTIDVPESSNFGVDKSELSNGLDVEITLPPGVLIQDQLAIVLENADGILETITHTITQEDLDTNNVAINFNNHDLSGEQTLDIHAYITDEVGNKSSSSEKFEVIVDTLAPGEKAGINGTDEKPVANLIEVSVASGDSYINKADYDSVQNGDAVPFTVSLPQGTRVGDYVKFELTHKMVVRRSLP